jgi:hypothetical protein
MKIKEWIGHNDEDNTTVIVTLYERDHATIRDWKEASVKRTLILCDTGHRSITEWEFGTTRTAPAYSTRHDAYMAEIIHCMAVGYIRETGPITITGKKEVPKYVSPGDQEYLIRRAGMQTRHRTQVKYHQAPFKEDLEVKHCGSMLQKWNDEAETIYTGGSEC